ncbi:TPA: hypothetical protein QDC20_003643 [Burkholderia aenigmatica]|uniref:hypothetical protein n=1 Tax=Burkholderia sp. AU45251 TaxID=3059204 RepID=UPI00264E541B|nr:hypothetical protein [Burkholderia sp. AU45251]HDR9482826.1 hypothetical protein [Burkholderia aenigmatica]MDN7519490.1 hypothetical protein [Burkholderia sp. AU45251]HDR9513773.1 hypothetical protein [Burkholderia aenigmatica]HDR9591164.1 hypothetical protein [Burkholderia aenigmatica]HDR9599146.1 hypothetical protein [Burkholderia aenigmatica]
MSAVRLPFAAEDAGRAVFRRDKDGPDWVALVDRILGPVVTEADRERRRADALALSAAAMKAAEDINLSNQR